MSGLILIYYLKTTSNRWGMVSTFFDSYTPLPLLVPALTQIRSLYGLVLERVVAGYWQAVSVLLHEPLVSLLGMLIALLVRGRWQRLPLLRKRDGLLRCRETLGRNRTRESSKIILTLFRGKNGEN